MASPSAGVVPLRRAPMIHQPERDFDEDPEMLAAAIECRKFCEAVLVRAVERSKQPALQIH